MLSARSVEEALLYLDLHFCSCDQVADSLDHWREKREDVFIAVYEGQCPRCGETGRFEFQFDPLETVPSTAIGGATASQIIDPGEFLRVSDTAAARVPVDASGLSHSQAAAALISLEKAIAALEEVRKFIPEGEVQVPESAFFTEFGRETRRASPDRFRREEIDEQLMFLRQGLSPLRSH